MDTMTDIVDCLEGTSFDHPGRQDVTVYLLYYPCPRAEIKVFAGSVMDSEDTENPIHLYKNNCIDCTSYQLLTSPKNFVDRYKSQVPNFKKALSPCGRVYLLKADFISFERNLHFCLEQIFEVFNVVEIQLDAPMSSGLAGSRVPDVFADIMENFPHEINLLSMGEPLNQEMVPLFKAIGKIKIFRLRIKSEKKRLPGEKIQDIIKQSVELLRPFEITLFKFHWDFSPTKLSRFDLAEFNLLGNRPCISAEFITLLPSALQDLIDKWKKNPVIVKRIVLMMELHGPVRQLMLMENQTETAKKKIKKLLKSLSEKGKEYLFTRSCIPIAIFESNYRFLMIEAEPGGMLHIYTTERKPCPPSTSH